MKELTALAPFRVCVFFLFSRGRSCCQRDCCSAFASRLVPRTLCMSRLSATHSYSGVKAFIEPHHHIASCSLALMLGLPFLLVVRRVLRLVVFVGSSAMQALSLSLAVALCQPSPRPGVCTGPFDDRRLRSGDKSLRIHLCLCQLCGRDHFVLESYFAVPCPLLLPVAKAMIVPFSTLTPSKSPPAASLARSPWRCHNNDGSCATSMLDWSIAHPVMTNNVGQSQGEELTVRPQ